jgi:hypothetical protein
LEDRISEAKQRSGLDFFTEGTLIKSLIGRMLLVIDGFVTSKGNVSSNLLDIRQILDQPFAFG